jgi:RBAM_031210
MPERIRHRIYPFPLRSAILAGLREAQAARPLSLTAKINRVDIRDHYFPVGSGFTALRMAISTVISDERDEVIIPSFACPDVPDAVISVGARPCFADVESKTFGLSAESVLTALTDRTAAVVLVNLWGFQAAEASRIREICKLNGISLIDDAAQALDAGDAGYSGDFGIFSFGRTKPAPGLGGGLLWQRKTTLDRPTQSNPPLYTKRLMTNIHAITQTHLRELHPAFQWVIRIPRPQQIRADVAATLECRATREQDEPISQLEDLIAGLSLSAFRRNAHNRKVRWRALASKITASGLRLLEAPNMNFAYAVAALPSRRARSILGRRLSAVGVQTSWHPYPCHLLSRYRPFAVVPLPMTEKIWGRHMLIPMEKTEYARDIRFKSGDGQV